MHNYFRVPNSVFDLGLSASELVVLMYLYRCHNNKDDCWPSYVDIASKCSITRRNVINVIRSLNEMGLIGKERQGRKNHYKIKS
jgi:DNA-binding MarR family transcriptional regulator